MEDAEGTFRDSVATIDEKGKRIWVFPKRPKGKFYNYRKITSYLLLLVLLPLAILLLLVILLLLATLCNII